MNEIIDCHSHIGIDWVWGNSSLEGYLLLCEKLGVTESLLMVAPGLKINDKRLLFYNFDKGKVSYESGIGKPINSSYYNEYLFNTLKCVKNDSKLKINFVPIIHPMLDNIDYLYYLKEELNVKAFKMHGVAMGFYPEIINENFTKALKEINIPIIVHTDYNKNDPYLIQNYNQPISWINYFLKNDLKGYITHAARLDFNSFDLINKNENLVIGISPDLMILFNKHRLYYDYKDNETVLNILRDNVNHDKIMFDIDYSWNVNNGKEKVMDFNQIERIKSVFEEKSCQKILSKNAKNFFKLGG